MGRVLSVVQCSPLFCLMGAIFCSSLANWISLRTITGIASCIWWVRRLTLKGGTDLFAPLIIDFYFAESFQRSAGLLCFVLGDCRHQLAGHNEIIYNLILKYQYSMPLCQNMDESFRKPHLALEVFIGLYSFLLLYLYFMRLQRLPVFYLLIFNSPILFFIKPVSNLTTVNMSININMARWSGPWQNALTHHQVSVYTASRCGVKNVS